MELTPDELRKMLEHHSYASFTVMLHAGWTGEGDQPQNKHRCLRFDVKPDNQAADQSEVQIQYMVDGFTRKQTTLPLYLLFSLARVIANLERRGHGGTLEKSKDPSC